LSAATARRIGALLFGLSAACAPSRALVGTTGLMHEKSIHADDRRAALRAPEGVACAGDGKLVVADTGNGRLLTYTWKEGQLGGGGQIRLAQLPRPTRVERNPGGGVLVLDGRSRRIARVDEAGAFAGQLDIQGASGPKEIVPISFTVGPSNVYVLDAGSRRVLVVDAAGKVTREIPLPAGGSFTDIARDGKGRLYALDAVGAALWRADAGGRQFQPLAADLRLQARFPASVASDRNGGVYVVDRHGGAVVVLDEDGRFRGRGLGLGRADGLLDHAAQICVTGSEVFVADRNNNRVQVFSVLR
jgi:DNA-binding beta-propeller fold protein YncE